MLQSLYKRYTNLETIGKNKVKTAGSYVAIMNHSSGFIIGIARKNCENPNRTFTKIIFKPP